VVNVAPSPASAYFPDLLPVPVDTQQGFAALVGRVGVRSAWPPGMAGEVRQEVAALLRPDWRGETPRGLTPQAVLRELRCLLAPEAIVTCDVGSHRQLTAQLWPAYWRRTFLTSNGLSSVGYALPAAIAAKLASPDRQVACLVGDGGLLMYPGELQTLARLGLRVLVVVWADFGSSSTKLEHEKAGYPTQGGTFGGEADFALLARSFGIWATTLESPEEIQPKLAAALAQPGPALVQVPIEYDVYRGMEL
jgi:acetolactate synthase-1/2/3 large subunit